MEAREYCESLQSEVKEWKEKVHDAAEKFDEIASEEEGKVIPFVKELNTIIEQHTVRMEELSRACPEDLALEKGRKDKSGVLRRFWNGLRDYHFWYRPHL